MSGERFRPLVPDPYDDARLFGDRPEPVHLGIVAPLSTAESKASTSNTSLVEFIQQRNERLAAQLRAERFIHTQRSRDTGSFVFRHKVAAITGAALVGAAAVGGRLLRRK